MTGIAIFPIPTAKGGVSYHAVSADKHSLGDTAGAALDALTAQLSDDEAGPLVIVQSLRPDGFFDKAQQWRLVELMERWRTARESGTVLPPDEQSELSALVEAELRASAERAAALARESGR